MYEYAFINENGTVLNICIFDKKDSSLIEEIKNNLNAIEAICCNDFGTAEIGGLWNGSFFSNASGERLPPTAKPLDNDFFYKYDWELDQWIPFIENKVKNLLMDYPQDDI